MTHHILVLNGPNLNLTGKREVQHYGSQSLPTAEELVEALDPEGRILGVKVVQSNHEGVIVDAIQRAMEQGITGIVINPGGFTHTSVAIADALRASGIPAVEVHLSHLYAREEFRRHNLIAPACIGSISGLGTEGYRLALAYLILFQSKNNNL